MAKLARSEGRRRRAQRPQRSRTVAASPLDLPREALGTTALATPDAARRSEELLAEDPDLRAYIRSPYSPDTNVRAGRFLTRGQLAMAESHGWTRWMMVVMTALMSAGAVGGAALLAKAIGVREGTWGATALQGALMLGLFGTLTCAFARRLLRSTARQ